MLKLFEIKKENLINFHTHCPYKKIEISKITSNIIGNKFKDKILKIYWNIITCGNAKVYLIRDDNGVIIHKSYVIPKCIKFNFLKKDDIEIGPCWTSANWRGQSIYPYVLSNIINNELTNDNHAFMIVNINNIPSIHGISKVGFKQIATVKTTLLKNYVIKNFI